MTESKIAPSFARSPKISLTHVHVWVCIRSGNGRTCDSYLVPFSHLINMLQKNLHFGLFAKEGAVLLSWKRMQNENLGLLFIMICAKYGPQTFNVLAKLVLALKRSRTNFTGQCSQCLDWMHIFLQLPTVLTQAHQKHDSAHMLTCSHIYCLPSLNKRMSFAPPHTLKVFVKYLANMSVSVQQQRYQLSCILWETHAFLLDPPLSHIL